MIKNPQKPKPLSYYSKKADRLMQEIGRKTYNECLVCGNKMSCLHHYYPKSQSTRLRYNWKNLIPICQPCHFSHHNGNPEIHNKINNKMGKDWLIELWEEKRKPTITTPKKFYKEQINILKEIIEKL